MILIFQHNFLLTQYKVEGFYKGFFWNDLFFQSGLTS